MKRQETPLTWRRGFALYRRRLEQDSAGEDKAVYDMAHPDLIAADGSREGICWQSVQSWQSSGHTTSGWKPQAQGEQPVGILEGRIFSDLDIAPFDRVRLKEGLYEVRYVQRWPHHRKLLLQQIG